MVPFECLKIAPKQRYQKKLNDQQLATLIRSAARPADERQREIEDWVARANVNADPVSLTYFVIGHQLWDANWDGLIGREYKFQAPYVMS